MKTKVFTALFFTLLMLFLPAIARQQTNSQIAPPKTLITPGWEHVEFDNFLRVLPFINGEGNIKPAEFQVAVTGSQTASLIFHVFYRRAETFSLPTPWKVIRAYTPEEVGDFINAQGSWEGLPATEFRICGAATKNQPMMFFIFYREQTDNVSAVDWGWKLSESVEDAHKFLNQQAPYTQAIADAEVTTVGSSFYIFYRPLKLTTPSQTPLPGWGWVRRESVGSAVDILNSGTSQVKRMMGKARIASLSEPPYSIFYIFYQ